MQDSIFGCIQEKERFIRKSDKILQRKQEKFSLYNPLFVKWVTYIPINKKITPILNVAFNRCKQFLDKKFIEIFPRKGEFSGRFWELFLCDFFLTKNIELDSKKKEDWTPDFCAIYKNKKIWIEARTPSKHDSVKDLGNWTHKLDEISLPRYLRLSWAFIDKSIKWYETYLRNWCKKDEPFIIAINGNEVDSWSTDKWLLGILYWIWLTQIDINWNVSYQNLSNLKKEGTNPFEVWYFLKPEFAHVSWVIYLESSIYFQNDDMLVEYESFQYIPNINAKNPTPEGFIKKLNLYIPINFK